MSTKTLPRKPGRVYFTTPEAAAHMRVSVDKIRGAINDGRLKAKYDAGIDPETGKRRPGGVFLISSEALDAWFDSMEDA